MNARHVPQRPILSSSVWRDACRGASGATQRTTESICTLIWRPRAMKMHQKLWLSLFGAFVVAAGTPQHASAQAQNKPNILFIMGDDIGWMQPSIYHQGLMDGETPNIDRIGQEGA